MKGILLAAFALLSIFNSSINGQQSDTLHAHIKIDFVNRHLWRGMRQNTTPAVQPTVCIEKGRVSSGFWASYSLGTENVQEIDLYITYKYRSISFSIYDYYNPIDTLGWKGDFLEFSNGRTRHTLDGILTIDATEAFPLSLTFSTMFYGFDKNTLTHKNFYSTYIEADYEIFKKSHSKIKLHLGVTPFKSYYASRASIVNTGVTVIRDVRISQNFSIPVKGSLIFNPYLEQIYVLAALSLK